VSQAGKENLGTLSEKDQSMGSRKEFEIEVTAPRRLNIATALVSPESTSSSTELQVDYEVQWKDPQSNRRNVVSPESHTPSKSPNLKHRVITPEKDHIATHTKHAQDDAVKVAALSKETAAPEFSASIAKEGKSSKAVAFENPDLVHTRFVASPKTTFSREEDDRGSMPAPEKLEFIPVPVPVFKAPKQEKHDSTAIRAENPPMRYFHSASTPYVHRNSPSMRFTPPSSSSDKNHPPFTSASPPIREAGSLAYETAHHMRLIPPKLGYHTTYQDDYQWHAGAYGESDKTLLPRSEATQTGTNVPAKLLKPTVLKMLSNVYPSKQAKRDAKTQRRKKNLEQRKPLKRTIPIMYQTEYMRAYGCPMR